MSRLSQGSLLKPCSITDINLPSHIALSYSKNCLSSSWSAQQLNGRSKYYVRFPEAQWSSAVPIQARTGIKNHEFWPGTSSSPWMYKQTLGRRTVIYWCCSALLCIRHILNSQPLALQRPRALKPECLITSVMTSPGTSSIGRMGYKSWESDWFCLSWCKCWFPKTRAQEAAATRCY